MSISATCSCGHIVQAPDSAAGRKIRCPECGQPVKLAGGASAAPAPVARPVAPTARSAPRPQASAKSPDQRQVIIGVAVLAVLAAAAVGGWVLLTRGGSGSNDGGGSKNPLAAITDVVDSRAHALFLAQKMQCAANASKIAKAVQKYMAKHHDQAPTGLNELVAEGLLQPECLVCPTTDHPIPQWDSASRTFSSPPDYTLEPLVISDFAPENAVMVYDTAAHKDETRSGAYYDCHAEALDAAKFQQRLTVTREWTDKHPRK